MKGKMYTAEKYTLTYSKYYFFAHSYEEQKWHLFCKMTQTHFLKDFGDF